MYKIIFTDLDETLLDQHHVPQVNLEAIKKAKELGVKIVPCTGRGYDMTIDVLKELEQYDLENEYIIGYNGGLIVECKNAKELYFNGLDFETTRTIFNYGIDKDVCILIFTAEQCFIFNPSESEVARKTQQKSNFKIIDSKSMDFMKDMRIAKINYQNTNKAYLEELLKELKPLIEDKVSISFSSGRYMEFNKAGVNKGQGLKWLAEHLNIPIEQTIAIGDNYNDEAMLKVAGLSVAVQSADPYIQSLCDYVTQRDYPKGSVAEVIEEFILKHQ